MLTIPIWIARLLAYANGDGILNFLKVCFKRRNYNFNLELERACARSFCDGATFWKLLKDTKICPTPDSGQRLECSVSGRIRAYLWLSSWKVLHRKSFERKPSQTPSWKYNCAARNKLSRYRSYQHRSGTKTLESDWASTCSDRNHGFAHKLLDI